MACARDQTRRNEQLPIPTGLASCLTTSYSHQHLSRAAIRSFHVKQSHHESLQPDCRRTQYLDKAVMHDAAGRSSDPEPLTVEDKPIAISIMPIASRTFPVRVMGMRRSASTIHPRSIFFWLFSTPHAHHMPWKECMSCRRPTSSHGPLPEGVELRCRFRWAKASTCVQYHTA